MSIFPTRVLLATDGSEGAELAALKDVELARRTGGSELHVVHVGFAPAFLIGGLGTHDCDRMLLQEIEDEARELLRKLAWRVKVAGGEVAGTHLGMGEADLEIVACAKKLGADLIVMGCRSRGGIRRAIGASVSDAVIRCAPCPVLVVPSNEAAGTPQRTASRKGTDKRPSRGPVRPFVSWVRRSEGQLAVSEARW